MKRYLSLILIVALLSISVCFAEDEFATERFEFNPELTKVTLSDLSRNIDLNNSFDRWPFVWVLLMDACNDPTIKLLHVEDITNMLINPVYLGYDESNNIYMVQGRSDKAMISLYYLISKNTAFFETYDISSLTDELLDLFVETFTNDVCDEYSLLPIDERIIVLDAITNFLDYID